MAWGPLAKSSTGTLPSRREGALPRLGPLPKCSGPGARRSAKSSHWESALPLRARFHLGAKLSVAQLQGIARKLAFRRGKQFPCTESVGGSLLSGNKQQS